VTRPHRKASEFCGKSHKAKEWRCPRAAGSRWHLRAGHGEKFGRKQEDAIAALLTQRNVEEAARAAGMEREPYIGSGRRMS